MSDNWVVQNLENALNTWNTKLGEIWGLFSTSNSISIGCFIFCYRSIKNLY